MQEHLGLVIDTLRRDVEDELHQEVPHLLEVLATHPVLFHPERLVDPRRHNDDSLMARKPERERREDQVDEHRPDEQRKQQDGRSSRARKVLAHPLELHPISSRRCEGGVRFRPLTAAGKYQ